MDTLDDGVFDGGMGLVPPPEKHVGISEGGLGQAMVRFVERGGTDGKVVVLAEPGGDGAVDSIGVDPGESLLFPLVPVFVPDGDLDR